MMNDRQIHKDLFHILDHLDACQKSLTEYLSYVKAKECDDTLAHILLCIGIIRSSIKREMSTKRSDDEV